MNLNSPSIPNNSTYNLYLNSEIETKCLAESLGFYLNSNDLVTLSGELGVGKTTFARNLIRYLSGQPKLTITSPTYLLVQEYDGVITKLIHADLYRLTDPEELTEIGFNESCENAITIIEWPERLPGLTEKATVAIKFNLTDVTDVFSRDVSITADKDLLLSILDQYQIHKFLSGCDWIEASRTLISGDASGRRYERLTKDSASAVLMIVPQTKPEPILRNNLTYKKIAKLSVSLNTFVAACNALLGQGFSAPKILSYDIKNGLILTEDLGSDYIYNSAGPIIERYQEAVDFLTTLHGTNTPQEIPIYEGAFYQIPKYDTEALLIEVELFIEWYIPNLTDYHLSIEARLSYLAIWKRLIEPRQAEPHGWTLRDFHSPNILWLNQRSGIKRVGLIDIQDMVWGHRAYDLASLLQDARINISPDLELDLFERYVRINAAKDPNFDVKAFTESYTIYALQRITKILGIFVRLKLRDNKPEYYKLIPQLIGYLRRNISHPVLNEYREWLCMHCPAVLNDKSDEGC